MSDPLKETSAGQSLPPESELIRLGVLTRPHGHRGAIKMLPDFDVLEDFERLKTDELILVRSSAPAVVSSKSTPVPPFPPKAVFHVEGFFFHQRYVVLELREVPDMNHAELLRGHTVYVHEEDLWEPAEGEFFTHELIGFALIDHASGSELGTVIEVLPGAGHDFLNIARGQDRFLVPFAKVFVNDVSPTLRQIRVTLPPGLDEL